MRSRPKSPAEPRTALVFDDESLALTTYVNAREGQCEFDAFGAAATSIATAMSSFMGSLHFLTKPN
jgi:hypothetical protein